jgi:integrase
MSERLTDDFVRNALAPTSGQSLFWDTEVKGFALRVTAKKAKAFVLAYRVQGRQRRITIGSYPEWSVVAARRAAKDMKREVDHGGDPMGERRAQREAPTMIELWERYSAEYLPMKAPKSQADERAMWTNIVLPRLGREKLVSISHSDMDALHRHITSIRGTPIVANRAIAFLRRMFNLAKRWGWLVDNPATGVRANPEEKRNRYLNRTEIAALAQALHEHSEPMSANAIKLLMLTGARRGEVLNATWEMFDLENGVWTKPSSHTKQRRLHRVPLSGPATSLLIDLKGEATRKADADGIPISRFIFTGVDGNPLTDIKRTWASVCRKAGLVEQVQTPKGESTGVWRPTVRMHDLRHSFASILVSSGASLPLIGQMLGHTQTQTTARYAHLYDDPMREAAEVVGSVMLPKRKLIAIAPEQESADGAAV